MAPAATDDGFHEIQLNGKQLVFLFMAATVVSVVIFLCGVLVGRGVRAERASAAEASVAGDPTLDITPAQSLTPSTPPAASDPTRATPPDPGGDPLTYFKRLEDTKQPAEDIKGAAAKAAQATPATASSATASAASSPSAAPVPAPVAAAASAPPPSASATKSGAPPAKAPVAPRAAAPTPAPTTASASNEGAAPAADFQPPSTPGYAVQVAALNVRSEADDIAKHLASKGYAAYVSPNGSPVMYRVRVGSYKTRREAETTAAKLQKDEKLKTWVTR